MMYFNKKIFMGIIVFSLLAAAIVSFTALPAHTGEITVSAELERLKDKLYHNFYGGLPFTLPIPVGMDVPPPAGTELPYDLAVLVSVKKGDYVEVTFAGSIKANVHVKIVCTGDATPLFSLLSHCGGGVAMGATWKPYTVKGIYKATADGDLTFIQNFVLDNNNDYTVELFGIAASAKILPSAVEFGIATL